MTRVFNLHDSTVEYSSAAVNYVYIGRPSKWGNPFTHTALAAARFKVDSREAAVHSYERWIRDQPALMAALPELKGKLLGCWCKPRLCHGDVLIKLLDELERSK